MTTLQSRLQDALGANYRIERELGGGGMSRVFVAEEVELGRKVVVKVLPPDMAAGLNAERFRREIQLAASLQHPHIVPLIAAGRAGDLVWYTMPLIDGESLRTRLARDGELPIADAVRALRDVADALTYAHAHGVVHRDIKPDNVLVTGRHAVVTDFGVAKALSASTGEASLTSIGVALGTPAYMAPEQASADPHVDHRADIYAFGAMAYELLSGRPPFEGPPQVVLAAQVTQAPDTVTTRRQSVPPALSALVMRCLEKKPADRYQTAAELHQQLESIATPSGGAAPTTAVPTGGAQRKRLPWQRPITAAKSITLALLILGLVGLGAYFVTTRGNTAPGEPRVPRLVVLPFENLGPPDAQYFADGMTDEVTARLAALAGLAVIARQTAVLYKGSGKSPREIGEELDVEYILEATISWQSQGEGSRVRIRPQLIRAAEGTHVWADVYDEDLTEIFAVQTRMATRVVEALDVALADREQRALAATPTPIAEAHDFYLRGLDYRRGLRSFTERDTRIAIQMFERATQLDSRFALAYAALGHAHRDLYWFAFDRTPARMALAKQAIDRALDLDDNLPEARLARAQYHYALFEYDAAIRELEMLRTRQPHKSDVWATIGYVRRRQGRMQDAARAIERAVQLDKRSPEYAHNLGETYWLMRQYRPAERELDRSVVLSPEFPTSYELLAAAQLNATGSTARARATLARVEAAGLGREPLIIALAVQLDLLDRRYDESRRRLRTAAPLEAFETQFRYVPVSELTAESFARQGQRDSARAYYDAARRLVEPKTREFDWDPRYASTLAIAHAGLGHREAAVREARRGVELLPLSREAYRGAYTVEALARVYAMVGEPDLAIDELERLLSVPSHLSAAYVRLDPAWDPIREHPRYRALLAKYAEP